MEAEAAGGRRQAATASRVHRHMRIAVNVIRLRGGGDVAGGGVLEDGAVEVARHAGGDALLSVRQRPAGPAWESSQRDKSPGLRF